MFLKCEILPMVRDQQIPFPVWLSTTWHSSLQQPAEENHNFRWILMKPILAKVAWEWSQVCGLDVGAVLSF